MNGISSVRNGLISLSILISATSVWAVMPTNPVSDPNFSILPSGQNLSSISVSGERLSLTRGTGTTFTAASQASYEKIKAETLTNPATKTHWVVMSLDENRVIAQSITPDMKLFGASISKIFVGGTLLNKQNGVLSSSQVQTMADMLVVSSNEAWTELQAEIGNGDSNAGRAAVNAFTQSLDLPLTRGYQGYWGNIHGNELTAQETAEYIHHIYMGDFAGAETLWKFMHTCRTGAARGGKYIPSSVYLGEKTGTYDGPTPDPITGVSVNVDVRSQATVMNINNHEYAIVVLADNNSDEATAILVGGLFREYTGYTP